MSSFCKITIGKTPGATKANAMYITRSGACEIWETNNVPDEEHLGITRENQRESIADFLCEYAEQGRGERRDYRAVLSFDREVEKEQAMEMAREWLDGTRFRDNPALYAFHTNTDNPHIHVLVTARDTSGKKLDLSDRQYKSFDKAWAQIYDRQIERGKEKEHSEKCKETAGWKQEYAEQRQSGRGRDEIVAELGEIPRDRPTIAEYYQEKRAHDESSLADSLGRESEFLRGVPEDHRKQEPGSREPGHENPGTGGIGRGPEQPTDEVRGSLQDAEDRATVLRGAGEASGGRALPAEETIRDGPRRAQEEAVGNVQGAEQAIRGACEAGDRQGRRECEGQRAERGRNLQELCGQLTERFRARIAGGIEAFRDTVHSIGQTLKRIPEFTESVQDQFREWRDTVWQRCTGQPYQEHEESGGAKGSKKPERGAGWDR